MRYKKFPRLEIKKLQQSVLSRSQSNHKNNTTMSVLPKDFNLELLTAGEPEKHSGKDEYTTIGVKYAGKKFKVIVPHPGIFCNSLSEAPKNPHKLTQGISLETPELVNMHKAASDKLLQMVVDAAQHPNMPKFCKNFKSVQDILQARKFGTTVKTMIHYPEKRDAKGNGTGEPDPEATPKCYLSLIRSAADHKETPSKIWTNYYSAAMLNAKTSAAIKAGQLKESDFVFDPLDLKKKGVAMKAMPCYEVTDIYIADGNIVVRMGLSEVYILKFETKESQARKELRGQIALAGIEIEGPGAIPDEEETTDGPPVESMKVESPQNSNEKEFVVNITE